jgi:apolipoprotein N-acyltransferase
MMKRWTQFFKQKAYNFRWAILSGFLVGTSYIPFPPWALIFCYAPLWLFTTRNDSSPKESFWAGWLTQFILTLIGFHWIAHTAHEFGQMPWPISILALLLFASFMHLYIPTAVGIATWLQKKLSLSSSTALIITALLHSLLERIWPVIFDWHLGYSLLWARIPVFHLADIVGFLGLSTLVLIFNAWVGHIWLVQSDTKKALKHIGMLVFSWFVLIGLGAARAQSWRDTDVEVKATVIQANIGNMEKVYAEKGQGYQTSITEKFIQLTNEASAKYPNSDIYIWPETAFPDYLDTHLLDRKNAKLLIQNFKQVGRPLITGAYSKDARTNDKLDRSTYNGLFLINFDGQTLSDPYRKTELLAFGEYLPLSERFPILLKMLPFISNFGRGNGPQTMDWKRPNDTIRWGGQICYEGLYPGFSRGLAEKGADIVVNVTNDSWFGKTFEPHQHLYMTLARAIEIRRPLIRSTNTGISTAILASGDILQKSPLHQEWSGQFVVPYLKEAPTTIYVKWGHYDWGILLIVLFGIIIKGVLNARSRRT